MPGDSPASDDDDESLRDRWADVEQPFGDPEASGLIPEVTSSEPDEPDTEQLSRDLSDVDADLLNTFAVSVALTNLAVLLVSVGALVAIFRGQLEIGAGLIVIGLLTLLRVYQQYRSYKRDRDADTDSDTDSPGASNSEDEPDAATPDHDSAASDEPADPPSPGHNR